MLVVVVLDDRHQGVALEQQPRLVGVHRAGGRVVAMVGDRLGIEHHLVAADPQPPAQIHILEVGEVIVVEAADLQEHLAIDQHRAAVGEQQRLLAGVQPVGGHAKERLRAEAVEVHAAHHEVDRLAIPAQHARGHTGHALVAPALGQLDQLRQPIGRGARVVIQQRQVIAAGLPARPD